MSQNNSNEKTSSSLDMIGTINQVPDFDPRLLAVSYTDLKTGEVRARLPVVAQIAWFRLKYPEGKISVRVEHGTNCFVATARVYPSYKDGAENYISAIKEKVAGDYRSEKLIGAYAELLQDEKEEAADEDRLEELALTSPKVRELVIKKYLKEVAGNAPAAVIMADGGGAMVASPPKKPKSISEAGELAYELFKNKEK